LHFANQQVHNLPRVQMHACTIMNFCLRAFLLNTRNINIKQRSRWPSTTRTSFNIASYKQIHLITATRSLLWYILLKDAKTRFIFIPFILKFRMKSTIPDDRQK
jgi:hypothetical protein